MAFQPSTGRIKMDLIGWCHCGRLLEIGVSGLPICRRHGIKILKKEEKELKEVKNGQEKK
jgi:hypothetical protein